MAVRFFVDEQSGMGFTVTREQAEQLLIALGEEPPPPTGNFLAPFGEPWGGLLNPDPLLHRLQSLRRQLVAGRVKEFTSKVLDTDGLVRCLIALENLATRAAMSKPMLGITFREVEQ